MGLFGKLLKKDKSKSGKKGFVSLTISAINKETDDTVSVSFSVPKGEEKNFQFIPGQYLNFAIKIDGKEERRSYSICSSVKEPLTIAVKELKGGKVSSWFNNEAKVGDEIWTGYPEGGFKMTDAGRTYVAFAAGSGITPIFSIAKSISLATEGKLSLFYGSKTADQIIFKEGLDQLPQDQIKVQHLLSQEKKDGFLNGRLTKEKVNEIIKADLELLKADGFYICGPEDMIINVSETLKTFGVPKEKINFELFTTPTKMKSNEKTAQADYKGMSNVTVIIDDEESVFELDSSGDTILDEVESQGIDAPFSCRGGVCSTCKAKVLKGSATMDSNMALTDAEVEEGFILTCQAHPNSKELTVSYDE